MAAAGLSGGLGGRPERCVSLDGLVRLLRIPAPRGGGGSVGREDVVVVMVEVAVWRDRREDPAEE